MNNEVAKFKAQIENDVKLHQKRLEQLQRQNATKEQIEFETEQLQRAKNFLTFGFSYT